MYSKELEENVSKFMSFVLRHQPSYINISLDENGWISTQEFIEKSNLTNQFVLDMDLLEFVVKNNKKQRFAFNEDKSKIRANQGHTIKVDLDLEYVKPPEFLYHGTATRNVESIMQHGLKPMERHDVHLSKDIETAISVGMRYGKPIVLKIDTEKMYKDGLKFKCSQNQVWLTENVPVKYIQILD